MSSSELIDMLKRVSNELNTLVVDFEGHGDEFYTYFGDVLDVDYRVSRNKTYKGVCLLLACGGPTIWLDTYERKLKGHWGGDEEALHVNSDVCEMIDQYFEEIYNSF